MTKNKLQEYNFALELNNSAFIIDEKALIKNLEKLKKFGEKTDVEIIFALKGFATWKQFPLLKKYFNDASCSSMNELKLALEFLGGETHAYFVAYKDDEFNFIASQSKTLTLNSIPQLARFYSQMNKYKECTYGLRINPEVDLIETEIYNPCSPNARLGITKEKLAEYLNSIDSIEIPPFISGLHLHALCEDRGVGFCHLLDTLEQQFQAYLNSIAWLNLGGGHLITSSDYQHKMVIERVQAFKEKYPKIKILIEPSSAFVWQAGVLAVKIIDIVQTRDYQTLIIDASFSCHTPDCLEMPYRPKAFLVPQSLNSIEKSSKKGWSGSIGGITCLAGDVINGFSFDSTPMIGDSIVFEDMLHYTMVKTTYFNGINHPSIVVKKADDTLETIKTYNYLDYKHRL